MMNEYIVEYFTKDNRRVGTRIFAYTSLDAKALVEKLPDFRGMANYPQKV